MPEPVREFFRVRLQGREDAAAFAMQLINAASGPEGIGAMSGPRRAVAFQPILPTNETEISFVSAGAAKLLRDMGVRTPIDAEPVPLRELPDGLALVIGDNSDVEAYEARRK